MNFKAFLKIDKAL